MKKEAEKRWRDHSKFQREFAEHISYAIMAEGDNRVDAIGDLVEFLLFEGMKHEHKHSLADSAKIVPESQNVPVEAKSMLNPHTGMGGCNDCSQEGISWRENERSFEAGP